MMSVSPKVQSPSYAAIQGIAHGVGVRIVNSRSFIGTRGVVGIWYWIDETLKFIETEKRAKRWEYEMPDIETVKRRINYLADAEWIDDGVPRPEGDPPLWENLPLKFIDTDPRTGHVRPQSTYRLKEEVLQG